VGRDREASRRSVRRGDEERTALGVGVEALDEGMHRGKSSAARGGGAGPRRGEEQCRTGGGAGLHRRVSRGLCWGSRAGGEYRASSGILLREQMGSTRVWETVEKN
jgi:hypothetical protein